MRLIQCHVENFGKLHDFTVDFSEGYNALCQQNGWGKSTFAAFIRVMFYGFEGETKRKALENERKRYAPWQGGTYGGQLLFEAAGKRYIVSRIFKDKDINDIFELRDADTNLESHDYSGNLGEELFQINSESFLRTVFISQNDCITNTTDSINAKMGNLTDNTGDLNSYKEADDRLTALLNRMTPSRKTGAIYQMTEKAAALKTEVKARSEIDDSIRQLQQLMQEQKEAMKRLKEEQVEISGLQKKVSRYQDARTGKEVYQHLCTEYEEKETVLRQAKEKFPKTVPREETLRSALEQCKEMDSARTSADIYGLQPEEEQQWNRLKAVFPEDALRPESLEEDLARCRERLTGSGNTEGEGSGTMQAGNSKAAGKPVSFLIIGAVIFLVGVLLCMKLLIPGTVPTMTGTGLMTTGIVLMAAGMVFVTAGIARTIKASNQEKKEEAARKREEEQALKERLKAAKEYEQLMEKAGFLELKKKQDNYLAAITTFRQKKEAVERVIQEAGILPEEDLQCQLQQMMEDLLAYGGAKAAFHRAKERKAAFERENDMEFILNSQPEGDMPNLEELNRRYAANNSTLEEIQWHVSSYERQIEGLQNESDEWNDKKKQLQELETEIDRQKVLYRRLQKTQELLANAKESLTSRYIGPLKESFSRYYEIVTGVKADQYYMDANTNVTVGELGMQRDTKYLSTGCQDVVGLCLRLALADAMYKDETPMLILDDPFVNLDNEKMAGGRRLLREISKKYQIVYLTCNEMRH